jgi:hypothetical protein
MVPRAAARSLPWRTAIFLPLVVIGLLLAASPVAAKTPVGPQLEKGRPGTTEPLPPPGYDVSYPQCGSSLPDRFAFAIVGVNGGRVYSPNPCLGPGLVPSQLAWGGATVELYANTANPGPELSSYWPHGQTVPRACDTDATPGADTADCAYDYGWNAAADSYSTAVAAYVALGLAPRDASRTPEPAFWWLDVETANSWRTDHSLNVAALEGARDYLESVDVAGVGFYSAPRMWLQITGGTDAFAEHPSWVAGASTLRGAMAYCSGTGFTGGPVQYAQYFANGFDANHRC